MTSVVFQPLLHDPFGWKSSKSCYTDHYKWKKYGSTNKDKLISTYGQRYRRQLRKQKQPTQTTPVTSNGEQPANRVIVLRKHDDNREQPISYQYLPTKTPVFIVEHKQRPSTAKVDTSYYSEVNQRPPTAPAVVQEKPALDTTAETHQSSEETKPRAAHVDANNDTSRHWLTFPNPRTPQKIIDIKQRLGQWKVPATLAQPSLIETQQTIQPNVRPVTAATQHKQADKDQHQFLSFERRETPDDLRSTRHRIDKYRYHASLDNYPPRPQTCPDRRDETPTLVTPPRESENQSLPVQPSKTDVWIVDEEQKPTVPLHDSSMSFVQVVNCDNLPDEYADALETSNVAQREYEKNLKINAGRRPENLVYRLPAMSADNRKVSYVTYQNPHQSTVMNAPLRQVARASDNDLGVWMRNATDKERASAMKIVQEVLNPAILGYDKQSSTRASSGVRKLGHTRTQHKFPCEICEKLLIKRHVWDLSGLDTVTCSHRPQSSQVRA